MSGGLPIQFRGLRGPGSLLGHTRRLRFMDSLVEKGRISPSLLKIYIEYQIQKKDLISLEGRQQYLEEELEALRLRQKALVESKSKVYVHVKELLNTLVEELEPSVM